MAVQQVTVNSEDGATVGATSTDLISFYGASPVAKRSGSAQAEFTITIGTSETAWGFKTADQFNAFVAQMREIRTTLINLGLWTGS